MIAFGAGWVNAVSSIVRAVVPAMFNGLMPDESDVSGWTVSTLGLRGEKKWSGEAKNLGTRTQDYGIWVWNRGLCIGDRHDFRKSGEANDGSSSSSGHGS